MKIQQGLRENGAPIWLVLDDSYRPVAPVMRYLRHLESLQRSVNTLRAYAFDLKLFWEFLREQALDWRHVKLETLAELACWLRSPGREFQRWSASPARTETTINRVLSTVSSFYQFHEDCGDGPALALTSQRRQTFSRYKGFLHHAKKTVSSRRRTLRVKEPKRLPGCLPQEDVQKLLAQCDSIRDRLLLCILYETGLRIGEALCLRHEDMHTGQRNAIRVVPRDTRHHAARPKTRSERIVDVSLELMQLYSHYLIEEYPEDCDIDCVFVRPAPSDSGSYAPLSYSVVLALFRKLRRRTGIEATPHLFRHTHATELIRAGWNMAYVQRRLGHAHIQTTVNTYTHLTDADLDNAYRDYLRTRGRSGESRTTQNAS